MFLLGARTSAVRFTTRLKSARVRRLRGTPVRWIISWGYVAVKTGPGPIREALDVPVFQGIVVDVVEMALKVFFILDGVLRESRLPHAGGPLARLAGLTVACLLPKHPQPRQPGFAAFRPRVRAGDFFGMADAGA